MKENTRIIELFNATHKDMREPAYPDHTLTVSDLPIDAEVQLFERAKKLLARIEMDNDKYFERVINLTEAGKNKDTLVIEIQKLFPIA